MWFAKLLFCFLFVPIFFVGSAIAQGTQPVQSSQPIATDENGQSSLANDESGVQEVSAFDALVYKLRQGGIVVVIQIALSILGFAVALERIVNLRSSALAPPKLVAEADRLWNQGEYDQLIQTARKDGSVLGQVIEEVVRHRSAGFQVVSQLAGDVASREIRRHLQRLFPIALVATLEPLLGLLGTMLGMIGAFETVAVAGSMGDASILADDIAKALVTTAVGLIIAIPAVFVYQYLKSQVGFGSASLDQAASHLISKWMILGKQKTDSSEEIQADFPDKTAGDVEASQ